MNWEFDLPVKVVFGNGTSEKIAEYTQGWGKGLLVCDPALRAKAEEIMERSDVAFCGVFDGVSPNPDISEVEACCAKIRETGAEFLVALGGGSSMDLAKAACVFSQGDKECRAYHTGGEPFPKKSLPLVAVTTTSGTGSEVTAISVLTDKEKNLKGPMLNPLFYPKVAIVDPVLTYSVPPQVTASTGLDALSHAMEGYWSARHQPLCDAAAMHAAKLVFENLKRAYENPNDADAREKMSEASVIAGVAFSHPKTAASHGCSFPLTLRYGLPHGEACAFTLDALARIFADKRLEAFAAYCGFDSVDGMADVILKMKTEMGMKVTLAQAGIKDEEIDELARENSVHGNMNNNPVKLTAEDLAAMYRGMK